MQDSNRHRINREAWQISKDSEREDSTHPCNSYDIKECDCKGSCSCHYIQEEEPSIEELERMGCEGVVDATDGCRVEPDGICEHGHQSWFLYLGII